MQAILRPDDQCGQIAARTKVDGLDDTLQG